MSENTPGTYIRPIEMLEHEIRDRLADKNAEIASLRAELAEAQDEILALRSRELYVTAERDRLRAELANKATTAVLERVAVAQSADPGTDDLTVCLALEVADLEAVNSELRAAARRDAEAAAVAVAPRVTLADIEAAIAERYDIRGHQAVNNGYADALVPSQNHPLGLLSICILVMRNGFTVIGKSAPASAANFNAELGRKLAYEDAIRQLWPLLGCNLRQKLHEDVDGR